MERYINLKNDDYPYCEINEFYKTGTNFLSISEIARRLSRINRYCGWGNPPISVAQHSFILSYCVSKEHAIQALAHDMIECYTGDINGLLKNKMHSDELYEIEKAMEHDLLTSLGVDPRIRPAVVHADRDIVIYEMRALTDMSPITIPIMNDDLELSLSFRITEPAESYHNFMERWTELMGF